MTDLEITKLCAEAMNLSPLVALPTAESTLSGLALHTGQYVYCPLHDDAQAMALLCWLLERGYLCLMFKDYFDFVKRDEFGGLERSDFRFEASLDNKEGLRRRLCECVAKMQQSR